MSEQATKKNSSIGETISVIVQALLLAILLRTFLFQPFSIPSGSMIPTLLVGDYLFVSKFSYGYSRYSIPFAPNVFEGRLWADEPERGDIAVFRLPSNTDIDYIKRVIGLPGDRIQMINGVLHINGDAVKRVRGDNWRGYDKNGPEIPTYVETLPNGVSYTTLDINPLGSGDNTDVFEVPPGHFFMMGDNRDNSVDSRFDVGFVPFENFVGKASVLFFSIKNESHPLAVWKWPSDLRAGRLFQGL